jgi:hypothetical protein
LMIKRKRSRPGPQGYLPPPNAKPGSPNRSSTSDSEGLNPSSR